MLHQIRYLQPASDRKKASYKHTKCGENEDAKPDGEAAAESAGANINHDDDSKVSWIRKYFERWKKKAGRKKKRASKKDGRAVSRHVPVQEF